MSDPNPEAWQDHMPAIPLARAVPCFGPRGERFIALGPAVEAGGEMKVPTQYVDTWDGWIEHDCGYKLPQGLRVDLDDPQGFGYALRWWMLHAEARDEHPDDFWAWVDRHMGAVTTDADRLALAQACAEVQS